MKYKTMYEKSEYLNSKYQDYDYWNIKRVVAKTKPKKNHFKDIYNELLEKNPEALLNLNSITEEEKSRIKREIRNKRLNEIL